MQEDSSVTSILGLTHHPHGLSLPPQVAAAGTCAAPRLSHWLRPSPSPAPWTKREAPQAPVPAVIASTRGEGAHVHRHAKSVQLQDIALAHLEALFQRAHQDAVQFRLGCRQCPQNCHICDLPGPEVLANIGGNPSLVQKLDQVRLRGCQGEHASANSKGREHRCP